MLFRKEIQPACEYCVFGKKCNDDEVQCTKRGKTDNPDKCRLFAYDPCKRIPSKQKAMDFSKYTAEDFSL